MASYAYTFNSGDGVTPTRLNAARTVSEIVNADIKSDAAIAGTKISPNFGAQNVSATGTVLSVGSGGSYAVISGATVDGASLQFNRGGSASQNAYLAQFQGSLFVKNLDSGSIIFTNTTSDIERMRVKSTGQVRFVPLSSDPATAESGDVYYNSSTNKLRVHNGTSWVDLH